MKNNSGFTIVEVMVATLILTLAVLSMLGLFTRSMALVESQGASVKAQFEMQRKIEEILSMEYTAPVPSPGEGILEVYTDNGALQETPFALDAPELAGSGTVYANELAGMTDPLNRLMEIKVVVCYQYRNAIIGEDDGSGGGTALNGVLDGTEDANGNNELDSPCQIETVVVNRSY